METFNTDEISASQLGLLPLSTLTLGRLAVGFIGQLVSPGRLFYLYTATASISWLVHISWLVRHSIRDSRAVERCNVHIRGNFLHFRNLLH